MKQLFIANTIYPVDGETNEVVGLKVTDLSNKEFVISKIIIKNEKVRSKVLDTLPLATEELEYGLFGDVLNEDLALGILNSVRSGIEDGIRWENPPFKNTKAGNAEAREWLKQNNLLSLLDNEMGGEYSDVFAIASGKYFELNPIDFDKC